MARKAFVLGMACATLFVLALDARGADYQTCFAFDPVFVQGDQRTSPPALPPEAARAPEPAGRPMACEPAACPRLSLKVLAKALASVTRRVEDTQALRARGDTR